MEEEKIIFCKSGGRAVRAREPQHCELHGRRSSRVALAQGA